MAHLYLFIMQHATYKTQKTTTDIPTNEEFDFESNLATFDKVAKDSEEEEDNTNAKEYEQDSTNNSNNVYSKDDFFDSISCDALDKQQGIDNRLRGAAERSLNLDTFGAVSLGHGRRGGRGGRGRGGRGRGYGRGRGGGGRGYYNNRDENRGSTSTSGRRGGYGQEATGSGPAPKQNNRWKSNN
jgi:protein LSM14